MSEERIEEIAQRLFQMCLEVHQFCKKHPGCILVESWGQLMPSIKENYLKDARQINALYPQVPQGDDEGLLKPEEITKLVGKVLMSTPFPDTCEKGTEQIKELTREVAKAQRDLTRRERLDRPDREKIALCKLCNDYGMTEDAMRLCVEEGKIRQNHIDDAYSFAGQILALFDEEAIREEVGNGKNL